MAKLFILLVVALASAKANPVPAERCHEGCLIAVAGAAAAEGSATASDNHQAAISAIGIPASSSGSGWGDSGWSGAIPASILVDNQGFSEVGQSAEIIQVTSNTGNSEIPDDANLDAVQIISVDNNAQAGDSLDVAATGGEVNLASSSDADVSGSGSLAAAGEVVILANNNPSIGLPPPQRSEQVITIDGATAVTEAAGWAGGNHAAAVSAVGIPGSSSGSGWGSDNSGWGAVPANIGIVNEGSSEVASNTDIVQVSTNDGVDLAGLQAIDVSNVVQYGDILDVAAIGGEVNLAASSEGAASGSGTMAAAADLAVIVDGASSLGMGRPEM